ncbi:MAG: glycoprotein [Ixodes ricinus orinovirus-like virus 1]|uniref:Glycoprotein n=1 Tax=Ixodes ricinus orinovirus-like virus 1 TaxID=2950736 RepID=A0AAE9LUL7_9MONO|nr:MAG: glycoprotein [Ixodes ricinus orinovirus-like virus 1]
MTSPLNEVIKKKRPPTQRRQINMARSSTTLHLLVSLCILVSSTALVVKKCQKRMGLSIYRLPALLRCNPVDDPRNVTIVLQSPNVKQHTAAAWKFSHVCRTSSGYTSFLGSQDCELVTSEKRTLSDSDVLQFKQGLCPIDGKPLVDNSTPALTCTHSWLRTILQHTCYCHREAANLYVITGHPVKADSSLKQSCLYEQGHCATTDNGLLTWTVDPNITEHGWLTVYKGPAQLSKELLTIDTLQTAFSIAGDTGEWTTTAEGYRFKEPGRRTRETDDTGSMIIDQARSDILSKLEYLTAKINGPLLSASEMCTYLKFLALHKTTSKETTTFYRNLLGTELIDVEVRGRYVLIWPCAEVTSWSVLTNLTKCHAEIPIQYLYNTEWKFGYLDPHSGDIVDGSLSVDCSREPLFYEDKGMLWSWHQNILHKLDTSTAFLLPHMKAVFSNLPVWSNTWPVDSTDYARVDRGSALLRTIEEAIDSRAATPVKPVPDAGDAWSRATGVGDWSSFYHPWILQVLRIWGYAGGMAYSIVVMRAFFRAKGGGEMTAYDEFKLRQRKGLL